MIHEQRRPQESRERLALWQAVFASVITILAATVTALVSVPRGNWIAFPLLALGGGILAAMTYRLASGTIVRQVRIALIGAPGVGKTAYVTSMFDVMQTRLDAQLGFAPSSETINRVLHTLEEYRRGAWAAKTASDYLYLYSARLSRMRPRRILLPRSRTEFDLQVADAAGEQLAEFVPGESRWAAKTSYYQYAVGSHALFLFLELPSIMRPAKQQTRKPLLEQVNDLIFVIQDLCEEARIGPSRRLDTPVALILSKADLVVGMKDFDPESLAEAVAEVPELRRLLAVAHSRCRWVKLFPVSSTGALPKLDQPPDVPQPANVEAPLLWTLSVRYGLRATSVT